jgi:hypothetical protein
MLVYLYIVETSAGLLTMHTYKQVATSSHSFKRTDYMGYLDRVQ